MADSIQLQGRPQVSPGGPAGGPLQAQARPGQYIAGTGPASSSGLGGLVERLAVLNPAVKALEQRQGEQDALAGREFAAKWDTQDDPRGALARGELQWVEGRSPAFNAAYLQASRAKVAMSLGVEAKTSMMTAYDQEKISPDFNPEKFLQQQRERIFAGVQDPTVRDHLAGQYMEGSARITMDQARVQQERRAELTRTGFVMDVNDRLADTNVPPVALQDSLRGVLRSARDLGMDPTQAGTLLLQAVQKRAVAGAGDPEVVLALTQRGPNGEPSLAEEHPNLAPHIEQIRNAAVEARKRAIQESTLDVRFRNGLDLQKKLEDDPTFIVKNPEILRDQIGPGGVFKDAGEASAFWAKAYKAQQDKQSLGLVMNDMNGGRSFLHSPEDQKRALVEFTKGRAEAFAQAQAKGDSQTMLRLLDETAQFVSGTTKSEVAVPWMASFIKGAMGNMADPAGPPPGFLTAAGVFQAWEASPQFRDRYFGEREAALARAYLEALPGSDPKAAYAAAYKATTDQGLKMAEDQKARVSKVAQAAHELVTGQDEWLPKMFGGVKAQQSPELEGFAGQFIQGYMRKFPGVSQDNAIDALKGAIRQNFAVNRVNGETVMVPPGLNGQPAVDALEALTKRYADQWGVDRLDGARVTLLRQGNGVYQPALLVNGIPQMSGKYAAPPVSLEALIAQQRADKSVTDPEELKALDGAIRAARGGQPVTLDPQLLTRAKLGKVLQGNDLARVERALMAQQQATFQNHGDLGFQPGDPSQAALVPYRDVTSTSLVAKQARGFAQQADSWVSYLPGTTSKAVALAASLITVGEGLVAAPRQDPNRAAGVNIGAGYNLKANADRMEKDLKAAGVPVDRIQDVLRGKATLTPEQLRDLTVQQAERYLADARKAGEKIAPGVWDRLSPRQQAVLTDIHYQTGGVGKFVDAWKALAQGDAAGFQKNIQVFYRKDSSDPSSPRIFDARRHDLHAAMLAGPAAWEARLNLLERK